MSPAAFGCSATGALEASARQNTCEAGAQVLDAASVFFDQTTWSVLTLESLSCECQAFDEQRAPVERSAALCVPASALNVDSSSDHS